jgi:hypothetical protein
MAVAGMSAGTLVVDIPAAVDTWEAACITAAGTREVVCTTAVAVIMGRTTADWVWADSA